MKLVLVTIIFLAGLSVGVYLAGSTQPKEKVAIVAREPRSVVAPSGYAEDPSHGNNSVGGQEFEWDRELPETETPKLRELNKQLVMNDLRDVESAIALSEEERNRVQEALVRVREGVAATDPNFSEVLMAELEAALGEEKLEAFKNTWHEQGRTRRERENAERLAYYSQELGFDREQQAQFSVLSRGVKLQAEEELLLESFKEGQPLRLDDPAVREELQQRVSSREQELLGEKLKGVLSEQQLNHYYQLESERR